MRYQLSKLEINILNRLVEHGYNAMIVGGAVRDWLIGKPFNDIDITTNAPYEKLVEILDGLGEINLVGKSYGVLMVDNVEIATYRTELCENNTVLELKPTSSTLDDSNRRDFTVNALYYNYALDMIHDFHGGTFDIENKIVKAVGNPYERFNEDYSRILRAIYLSSVLGFKIEGETAKAIRELGENIQKIPYALQGKIIKKTITNGCFHKFLYNLVKFGLLKHIFPETTHLIGLEQNPKYHKYDAWNHTLHVVKNAEEMYKGNVAFVIGAFLHDVAKGLEGVRGINKQGQPNDIGHEDAGEPIAKSICNRLELGKSITNEVAMYVKWHGSKMEATTKSVKHFLFKFKDNFKNISELKHGFSMLFDFIECDAGAFEDNFKKSVLFKNSLIREIASELFDEQIFYSNQFNFNASVISNHPNVNANETKKWIEFFVRQNIVEEKAVLKILDKQKETF